MKSFISATSKAKDWHTASTELLAQLGTIPQEASVGFIYATDSFAVELNRLLENLKLETGIDNWVGSVATGICCNNTEIHNLPAVTVMLADFPPESFTIFNSMENSPQAQGESISLKLALVHGDPRNGMVTDHIHNLPERLGNGYLVGGITSSNSHFFQVANHITEGDISGIVFDDATEVVTGLSQSCTPIGEPHTLTDCSHHIAITIDNRPALEVFKEEIGDVLARNIDRAAGYIFAGFPIQGSDTADYLVRDIIGLDIENGHLAIADNMEKNCSIQFCKRDGQAASTEMYNMLKKIKKRIGNEKPRGAIYISCVGRGENLFGPDSAELKMINEVLGDMPLAGFFANGEISGNQLYGYTGVLTVFL